jgi:hypothetical protein
VGAGCSGSHYYARYNVLTDKNNIYGSAFMFIRFILINSMPEGR